MIKLRTLLTENYQLALKLYGDRLSPENIEFLSKLSGQDHTFKTLADLMMNDVETGHYGWKEKDWPDAVAQLKNYHKNVFPIEDFSFDSPTPVVNTGLMKARADIIRTISKWPSLAKRNLKKDIAVPRTHRDFIVLKNVVEYIDMHLRFLENRDPKQKEIILKKIFSSDHPTFEEVQGFVEDKENLLVGGKAFSKAGLYQLVKKHDYDLKIVYDKGNIVVVDVTGQPGIKAIGCNSMWCFTYGNEYDKAGEQFDQYSYNGHVYAIIDFSQSQEDADFIYILIKPVELDSEQETVLYNMANEGLSDGNAARIIEFRVKDPAVFNVFKWENY